MDQDGPQDTRTGFGKTLQTEFPGPPVRTFEKDD